MKIFRKIPFVLLLLPLVAAIIIYHYLQQNKSTIIFPADCIYQALVTSVPQKRLSSIRAEVQLIWSKDSSNVVLHNEKLLLYFAIDSSSHNLQQGDSIIFYGNITHSNRNNPYEFDYDNWLYERGISGIVFLKEGDWLKNGSGNLKGIKYKSERCRQWFVNILKNNGINGDELAVVAAMTVGYRDELNQDIRQRYSSAGAMHILAVSGLHTGVVYGAIMFLLTGFGLFPLLYKQRKRRLITALLSILFIWCYCFLTGMSPSVMRASLMITIFAFGVAINRNIMSFNSLAAAAFFNLLIEPNALFTVSFQLSYAAVAGIFLFYNKIQHILIIRNKIFRRVWQLIVMSISAQLGTLSVSIWYFQQLSNYFAITNLFIIPLATLIIYSSLLLTILATTHLAHYVGMIICYLAKIMNYSVAMIDSIPLATINLSLTPAILCLLITLIICIALCIHRQKWQYLLAVIATCFLIICFHIFHLKKIQQINRTIVYNTNPYLLILHQQGRSCTILICDRESALQTVEPLRKQMMIKNLEVIDAPDKEAFVFRCDSVRYLCLLPQNHHILSLNKDIDIDVLLIGANGSVNFKNIVEHTRPKQIIMLSSLPIWKEKEVEKATIEYDLKLINVRKGAVEIK